MQPASEGKLTLVRATLQSETPVPGVELCPYVMCRRRDGSVTSDDIAKGSQAALDEGFYTRCVWHRSLGQRKTSYCSVNPERKATIQCVISQKLMKKLRELIANTGGAAGEASNGASANGVVHSEATSLLRKLTLMSFHCSPGCFERAWARHREEYRRASAEYIRLIQLAGPVASGSHGHHQQQGGHEAGGGGTPSRHGGRAADDAAHGSGQQQDAAAEPWRHRQQQAGEEEGWVEISRGRTYVPSDEDVGHTLRFECQIVDGGTGAACGTPYQLETSRVICMPPAPCRARVRVVPPTGPGVGSFTVLTYNVLADLYANKDMYTYCPTWALSWSYRRQRLIGELLSYDADIMCLQEVQSDHFDEVKGELEKHGYVAVYKKKTNEVFTGGAYTIDGCATFFREEKFGLVKRYDVEFNKAANTVAEAGSEAQKKAARNRLLKDNVALIIVLEAKDAPDTGGGAAGDRSRRQLMCLANTHIHANQELKDVKLWQVHTLLKGLEKIAASADIPMVVCGDLNSVPGSAPHSLIAQKWVDPDHPDLRTDPLNILKPFEKLQHRLQLVSAYSALANPVPPPDEDPVLYASQHGRVNSQTGEPFFTNCTKDFMETLDYIYYSEHSLVPVSLLELPGVEDTKNHHSGMPNPQWSSDHIALLAEFSYRMRSGVPGIRL